jgi:hypothetical protein
MRLATLTHRAACRQASGDGCGSRMWSQ